MHHADMRQSLSGGANVTRAHLSGISMHLTVVSALELPTVPSIAERFGRHPVTKYFSSDGFLAEAVFWPDVQRLLDQGSTRDKTR